VRVHDLEPRSWPVIRGGAAIGGWGKRVRDRLHRPPGSIPSGGGFPLHVAAREPDRAHVSQEKRLPRRSDENEALYVSFGSTCHVAGWVSGFDVLIREPGDLPPGASTYPITWTYASGEACFTSAAIEIACCSWPSSPWPLGNPEPQQPPHSSFSGRTLFPPCLPRIQFANARRFSPSADRKPMNRGAAIAEPTSPIRAPFSLRLPPVSPSLRSLTTILSVSVSLSVRPDGSCSVRCPAVPRPRDDGRFVRCPPSRLSAPPEQPVP